MEVFFQSLILPQGYFREIEHGILFLENRYTDWGNYYPHRTLRNIWQLARWIPAQRFHVEFLNPSRNTDKYAGDPFAPNQYPISYLYAITMPGHPLAWMEVQHLLPQNIRALEEIANWHRDHHRFLLSADIQPIGEVPCGRSWTGFLFHFPDGKKGVLVFREQTSREKFAFSGLPNGMRSLCGSANATVRRSEGELIEVSLPNPCSWAFLAN